MLNFKGEPLNLDALFISSVQFRCTVVSHSVTPWTAARLASLSITNSQSLLRHTSIESRCHPTMSSSVVPFSSFLQSFPASGSFSNKSALCIRCPKYWSFSFNISPSNEHPVEKKMATHSSNLAWRIPWTEEPGRLQSMGLQRVKHD